MLLYKNNKGYMTQIKNTAKENGEERDEDVLAGSLKNPDHFAIIIDRYQEPFIRKVRSILGPREEVHDIVQETFLKIYMNASRFQVREGASFKSWGYKILINTTFTYYQKLKKEDGAMARIDPEFYETLPDKTPPTAEITNFVASVMVRMPKHLAKALKLHFLDGMPQKEMAELEGISLSAVKTRVHRAKKEYRKIHEEIN